jgi:formate hydrogenlyase subunit 3/multisubunit Na+/H+ antiporter MnhD subunit
MAYTQLFFGLGLLSVIVIAWIRLEFKGLVAITSLILLVSITSFLALKAMLYGTFAYSYSGSFVTGSIPIIVDSLASWFILVINFTFVTGAIYGHHYLKAYTLDKSNVSLHWIVYLLTYSAMIAVCLVQNLLVFLIVWEIMALSSFFLIIFENHKSKTLKAGINYLIQSHIAIVFLTIVFVWVYTETGSFQFEALGQFSKNAKPFESFSIMALLFVGFGTKAGFVPLHTWLPHAHPESPSHVSGIMSGVIVKIGIYGIFRSLTFMHQDLEIIGLFIILISLVSGLFGIINAALHRDYKRMLAYCTIENIGILGVGIGLGVLGLAFSNSVLIYLGFGSALFHVLNHSLIKSLLFFAAGSIYQQTHTRDMEKLGGLIQQMPKTAKLFLVGALAIGGLPPFNAFFSEFMLYSGLIQGLNLPGYFAVFIMVAALAGLAVIGGISVFAFTKLFGVVFLGSPKSQLSHQPKEVSFGMRFPQYIILLAMFSVSLFPLFYFNSLINVVTNAFTIAQVSIVSQLADFADTIKWIGWYALLFIALAGLIYGIRKYFTRQKSSIIGSTWGCGYIAPSASMQYTGKSFSKTLAKLLYFMVPEQKSYKELATDEIFPSKRKHATFYADFFEQAIIDRILKGLFNFMNRFQFIQNGKLQRYILYGLFFIVLILFGLLITLINGLFR